MPSLRHSRATALLCVAAVCMESTKKYWSKICSPASCIFSIYLLYVLALQNKTDCLRGALLFSQECHSSGEEDFAMTRTLAKGQWRKRRVVRMRRTEHLILGGTYTSGSGVGQRGRYNTIFCIQIKNMDVRVVSV